MVLFDTKKHMNIKRHAHYRRINKYTKSLLQYKKEKLRRKQVLQLQDQGVSNKEIAVKLGISTRTVQRILEKPKAYIKRERKHFKHLEHKENIKQLTSEIASSTNCSNPLSIKKQLELITELNTRWSKNRKILNCKDLTITIDAEAAVNGKYAIRFKPNLPVEMLPNGKISIELQMFGATQKIGRIYVVNTSTGQILDTNQSLNAIVKPILTRFKGTYKLAQSLEEAQEQNTDEN